MQQVALNENTLQILALYLRLAVYIAVAVFLVGPLVVPTFLSLRPVFTPLCYLPGVPSIGMCQAENADDIVFFQPMKQTPTWGELVQVQTQAADQILSSTSGGRSDSLASVHSGFAVTDLVNMVKYSDLPERDMLEKVLGGVKERSAKAGRCLDKFNARANGAINM